MSYKMKEITPRVRIGQRKDGRFNLEVWTHPWREPLAECVEVDIPADAASDLGKYLMLKSAP